MKCYKLTNQKYQTYAGTQWGENVTHSAKGCGKNLCSQDYIHAYTHPVLAVLFNPIHVNINNPILWECEAIEKDMKSDGLKIGVKMLTTLKRIDLPEITTRNSICLWDITRRILLIIDS